MSLALFAALGAERGLAVGLGFWGTVFAGVRRRRGMIRDVLSGEVPRARPREQRLRVDLHRTVADRAPRREEPGNAAWK